MIAYEAMFPIYSLARFHSQHVSGLTGMWRDLWWFLIEDDSCKQGPLLLPS